MSQTYWNYPLDCQFITCSKSFEKPTFLIPWYTIVRGVSRTCVCQGVRTVNPFTPTRYPIWLKKIQLSFCNPYGDVKTISKESSPYITWFSENFVRHWCPSGWKRLFFPFHYEFSNWSGKSSKALIDL